MNNSMKSLPIVNRPQKAALNNSSEQNVRKSPVRENSNDFMKEFGIPKIPPNENVQKIRRLRMPRSEGRLLKQRTSKTQRILPAVRTFVHVAFILNADDLQVNRNDPSAAVPELNEEDARSGMLSLINRGFIPSNCDLTPAMVNGSNMISNR